MSLISVLYRTFALGATADIYLKQSDNFDDGETPSLVFLATVLSSFTKPLLILYYSHTLMVFFGHLQDSILSFRWFSIGAAILFYSVILLVRSS
jgi:hypothetical protein